MKYINSWSIFETHDKNDINKFEKKERKSLTVFHRTKDTNIDLIGRDGYRAGVGAAWGPGIYTCYDLISTTKNNPYNDGAGKSGVYGPIIIENKITSLKNFLIFNYDVAKKVYGKENFKLEDQLQSILPQKIYEKFKQVISEASQICDNLYKKSPMNKYTTDAVGRIHIIPEIRHYLRGMIFTGSNDGKVLLNYDRENLIPINYSKDNGKTWKKFTKQGIHRIARENLNKLLRSNPKDLSTYLEDHINNELTHRNFKSFDEYLKKTLEDRNFTGLDILRDFEYIFNLTEEEYPNIKSIRSQIMKLYKDYIVNIIDAIKEVDEIDFQLLNSNLFVTLPEKIGKLFPDLLKQYNSAIDVYLDKIIDVVKKLNDSNTINSSVIQLSNNFLYLNISDSAQSKDKIEELKTLVDDTYQKLKELIKPNNEIYNLLKDYCEKYKEVEDLVKDSGLNGFFDLQKQIEEKFNQLSQNEGALKYTKKSIKDSIYGGGHIRILTADGGMDDYFRITWVVALLPNNIIDNLKEIYNININPSNSYESPIGEFIFRKYNYCLKNSDSSELKSLFKKKIKSLSKYLDDSFFENLKQNAYNQDELIIDLLVDNPKRITEENIPFILRCLLNIEINESLIKRLKEIDFTIDKDFWVEGEYLIVEFFKSIEKLMQFKEILTEELFLKIAAIGYYTKNYTKLDENLIETIKEKFKDESFCIKLINSLKKNLSIPRPGEGIWSTISNTEALSMMPIKTSLIVKSNILDADGLKNFSSYKLKRIIKEKDDKKTEEFILFLIENGVKFNWSSVLNEIDLNKLKSETLLKILSSNFVPNDELLRDLESKGVKNDEIVKYCISNKIKNQDLFELTDNLDLKKQVSNIIIDEISKDSGNELFTSILYSLTPQNQDKLLKFAETTSSSSDEEDRNKSGLILFFILVISKNKMETYKKTNTKVQNCLTNFFIEIAKDGDRISGIWNDLKELNSKNNEFTLSNICKALELIIPSIKDQTSKDKIVNFIQKNSQTSEKLILNYKEFYSL